MRRVILMATLLAAACGESPPAVNETVVTTLSPDPGVAPPAPAAAPPTSGADVGSGDNALGAPIETNGVTSAPDANMAAENRAEP